MTSQLDPAPPVEKGFHGKADELSVESEQARHAQIMNDPRIKAIKRKIDIRLVLILGLLYTVSVLDRVNVPVCTSYDWWSPTS